MGLDAIGIVSSDIQKSLLFYSLLGLEFKPYGEGDHYEATTESGVRVMLDTEALMLKLNPDWQKGIKGAGIIIGFKQKTIHDVDKLVANISNEGFKVITKPWDAFWGQRYASVLDPDSNQIDIFAENSK